ncbi:uncharacterized protein [Littorina saxatilis]|uniref:uncharacterized protein n=1 Tax=Littorina saxatilis TaxID=31220 RepID=UPI0038B42440
MAELCDVERILKTRYRKGQKECLVKWKGWSSEHNTWEPEQNVVRPTMVLSNGDLKERLHDMKGLLSNIAEGSVVTDRRKSYQQGSRRSLDIDNGLALLPDDQEHVMMDTLMSMFPVLAFKNMDFIVRVLLPEAIFTIYSQVTSEALEDMPERTQNSGDDFSEENLSTGDEWIPEEKSRSSSSESGDLFVESTQVSTLAADLSSTKAEIRALPAGVFDVSSLGRVRSSPTPSTSGFASASAAAFAVAAPTVVRAEVHASQHGDGRLVSLLHEPVRSKGMSSPQVTRFSGDGGVRSQERVATCVVKAPLQFLANGIAPAQQLQGAL